MFIQRIETGSQHPRIKWNPERALASLMWSEVYKIELEAVRRRIDHSGSGKPYSLFVKSALQKDYEPLSVEEVLGWLANRAEEEVDTMEVYGGVEAARVAYGKFGKVAFAGEIPPLPDEPSSSNYPNFPA